MQHRFPIALIVVSAATPLALLALIHYQATITGAFPGVPGKLLLALIGLAVVGIDVWSILSLSEWSRKERQRRLQEQTGKTVEEWGALVGAQGQRERAEREAWLKEQFGIEGEEATSVLTEVERGEREKGARPGPDRRVLLMGCVLALMVMAIVVTVGMVGFMGQLR